jgi:hypothetical protein
VSEENKLSKKYRLSWKGVLFASEALLYEDADTPRFLLIPILVFLYLPKLFLSYLEVSDQGINLFYWPNYRINVSWQEVNRLGKAIFLGRQSSDVLYLRKGPEEGIPSLIDRHRGFREKRIIPLSDFRGWPDGDLYNDLMRYIPNIIQENQINS